MLRVILSANPARFGATALLGAQWGATQARFSSTTGSPSSPVAPAAEEVSEHAYVDFVDRVWNTKWFGTVEGGSAADAAVAPDSDWFTELFTAAQSALGVDAWAVILLFGVTTRLITLAFSLFGERATARMQLALPELQAPQEAFNKVYYNANASSMNVQLAAAALKSERRRVFSKYQTSNAKCLAPFLGTPFVLTGLYQVSALCTNPLLNVGTSSFFWCTALTLPDPFFVLPTTFCVLTLMNFELSITKEMKKGWMSNIIWGARLGCLCVLPVAATFRSGVSLYFIGMSIAGLLQPLLVRAPKFRKWCGFPTLEQVRVVSTARSEDAIQSRMSLQFPYLSHLLNPETDENAQELFKRADTVGKPSLARNARPSKLPSSAAQRGPATPMTDPEALANHGRYQPGSNPLMREVPVRQQPGHAETRRPSATAASLGSLAHGTTATHGGSTTPERTKATPGKGSAFASSGWKASNVTFDESDFSPFVGDSETRSRRNSGSHGGGAGQRG